VDIGHFFKRWGDGLHVLRALRAVAMAENWRCGIHDGCVCQFKCKHISLRFRDLENRNRETSNGLSFTLVYVLQFADG